jgi:hypothetical protein
MSDGSKWLYRRVLGNTGECRRKAWLSQFVRSEGATDPGWARRDEPELGTGGVLLWRAVLGTGGVAAVSPW